jgi:hypothetical protein
MLSLNKKTIVTIPILFFCLIVYCQDINHSFRPGQIWPDNEGRHINAHGGGRIYYNDAY